MHRIARLLPPGVLGLGRRWLHSRQIAGAAAGGYPPEAQQPQRPRLPGPQASRGGLLSSQPQPGPLWPPWGHLSAAAAVVALGGGCAANAPLLVPSSGARVLIPANSLPSPRPPAGEWHAAVDMEQRWGEAAKDAWSNKLWAGIESGEVKPEVTPAVDGGPVPFALDSEAEALSLKEGAVVLDPGTLKQIAQLDGFVVEVENFNVKINFPSHWHGSLKKLGWWATDSDRHHLASFFDLVKAAGSAMALAQASSSGPSATPTWTSSAPTGGSAVALSHIVDTACCERRLTPATPPPAGDTPPSTRRRLLWHLQQDAQRETTGELQRP
eukprot:CAMPEP_0182867388 /NCGR_PEP_ID=MMETSP0034_2-20130328/8689_1 /TAXON_ID=156128 /ORGANISM="Nephroselmis pyriformis, Strain CCMP717" /LENGTH=325 /DNA_ID=CAMNT_0024999739 /DNA_START=482 /DNA_END=1457 /DNA_ORIENTATION=-